MKRNYGNSIFKDKTAETAINNIIKEENKKRKERTGKDVSFK